MMIGFLRGFILGKIKLCVEILRWEGFKSSFGGQGNLSGKKTALCRGRVDKVVRENFLGLRQEEGFFVVGKREEKAVSFLWGAFYKKRGALFLCGAPQEKGFLEGRNRVVC